MNKAEVTNSSPGERTRTQADSSGACSQGYARTATAIIVCAPFPPPDRITRLTPEPFAAPSGLSFSQIPFTHNSAPSFSLSLLLFLSPPLFPHPFFPFFYFLYLFSELSPSISPSLCHAPLLSLSLSLPVFPCLPPSLSPLL